LNLLDQTSPTGFMDFGDDVLREVEHLLQNPRRDIQQQADSAGRAFDKPDVADGRGKLDVAHSLATNFGTGYFDATLVTDDALVADTLVFAAGAFPVLGWTKNTLAEQAVSLRLEGAVIDRLRLCDFAARPGPDLL